MNTIGWIDKGVTVINTQHLWAPAQESKITQGRISPGVEQGYKEVVMVSQSPAPVWFRSQGGGVKSLKEGDWQDLRVNMDGCCFTEKKKRLDVLFSIISQRIKWEWERRTWKLGWGLWAYDKWVDTKVICDERKGHKSPLARDKENDSLCRKQDLSSSPWGNRGFCLDAWPWEKDFFE